MQSKATTVTAYLASLPPDRRAALEAVRKVIKRHVDADIEEGMQYGMIGYYVPPRIFPDGYTVIRANRCPMPSSPRRRTTCRWISPRHKTIP